MIRSFLRLLLVIMAAGMVAIQAAAFMLGWPMVPEPLLMAGIWPLHGPASLLAWYDAGLLVGDVRQFAISAGVLTAGLCFMVWIRHGRFHLTHREERRAWGRAGSARRGGLLSRRGVVLGRLGGRTIRDDSDGHVAVMAPPGAGKSSTIAVPTLLGGWRQSVVVHDPKGELWSRTSAWRRRHVGPVLRFDLGDPATVRYNPMDEIRWGTPHRVGDAQALARALVPQGSSKDSYFDNLALQFLTSLILYVGERIERPSLAHIHAIAASFEEALPRIAQSGHPEGRQLAERLDAADAKMRGIFESEILSHVWQFADPLIARATGHSDFRAGDLMCERRPLTLYLCVPARHQHRVAPVYRVVLQSLLGALCEREREDLDGRRKRHRLLALIDEFPSLGRMEPLRVALPIVRSYGLKVVLIAQSTRQLAEIYGPQNSFLDMVTSLWIAAGSDPSSLADYSRMSGDVREYRHAIGSEGRLSHSEQLRPRLTPGDLRELDRNEILLLRQGVRPFRLRKIRPWRFFSRYRRRQGEAFAATKVRHHSMHRTNRKGSA